MAVTCALVPTDADRVPLSALDQGEAFYSGKDYWLKSPRMYDDHTVLCVRLTAADGLVGDDGGFGADVDVIPIDLQLILA